MLYFRCKCGELWGSNTGEPIPPCIACEKCGTTLATHPDRHKEAPEPHDLREQWRVHNGQPFYERVCNRFGCGFHEDVPRDQWPALNPETPTRAEGGA